MAVSHYIETQTGWSIEKFVRTARRYRTVKIRTGRQILTATDPLPDDLREAIDKIGGQLEHWDEPTRGGMPSCVEKQVVAVNYGLSGADAI